MSENKEVKKQELNMIDTNLSISIVHTKNGVIAVLNRHEQSTDAIFNQQRFVFQSKKELKSLVESFLHNYVNEYQKEVK